MKKINIYFILWFLIGSMEVFAQQNITFTSKDATISFFSSAPLEDIEAKSNLAGSALNISTGDIIFKVKNTSFEFDKKLMQEHFNENYMESDKYPFSEFKGKIEESKKLNDNGNYTLKVSGTLQIHGVNKPYVTLVAFNVKNSVIKTLASFDVRLSDHKITIPSIVGKNIAEVVKVKIDATYKNGQL
ncbi:YceI family protein [Sphingobacterium sp. SRCM116780]|uniref:YceI family protein n=1 Tax=Sphingobacterium sp. SRCM116780 TaxID=2907623 RepID=UPI001F2A7193|nr:YceI family protein [Sphingobacterium sp. SRCM116780]UIR55632.1 YceI family protein [Sphingobacterium sp. SRCM116780]